MTQIREDFFIHPDCRERFAPSSLTKGSPWDAAVELAGISELKSGYRISRIRHAYHVVFLTLSGEGIFSDSKREEPVAAGDLAVVPAGVPYSCRLSADHWNTAWFHLNDISPWEIPKAMEIRPCPEPDEIAGLFSRSLDELDRERERDPELASLLFRSSLHSLRRELAGKGKTVRTDPMAALWDNISRDPGKSWPVDAMARELALSPRHFSRRMKERYGLSPHEFLTRLRMDRARFLLKNTDYPLSVIAENLGYDNAYSFSTAFKKHWGDSPGRYRKD